MEIRQQKQKKNKEKKVKIKTEEPSESEATKTTTDNAQKRPLPLKPDETAKKLKTVNGASTSLSKIGNIISSGKVTKAEEIKKMKADYSVAKDKNVSDVYKSLFTSHKSEKEQTRAHWVTYNPFYN